MVDERPTVAFVHTRDPDTADAEWHYDEHNTTFVSIRPVLEDTGTVGETWMRKTTRLRGRRGRGRGESE